MLQDLQQSLQDLDEQYKIHISSYKEELEKIEKYKVLWMVIIIKCLAERIKMPDYYSDPFFFWTHNYSNYLLFGLFIIRTDYCSNEINSRTKNYSSDKSVITHKYIIQSFLVYFSYYYYYVFSSSPILGWRQQTPP